MHLMRAAFIPFVVLSAFVWRSWPDGSPIELTMEGVGYIMLMLGVAVRLWATLYIGGRKSRELITDGPYSMCRNPLYVGTMLLAIGASLCLENILLLAATLLIFVPVHAYAVVLEERRLAEAFGAEFVAYRQRVPRFLFSFRHYCSNKTVNVSADILLRCAFTLSFIVAIPLIEELVEMLHANGLLPVLWRPF